MKNKNVLVTGGAGFIGSHLVKELNKKGIIPTIIDDLSNGSLKNIEGLKFDFLKRDLTKDMIFDNFDIIYNLAYNIDARSNDVDIFLKNIDVTRNTVKCLNEGGHMIFASSCAVYGNNLNATETDTLKPFGQYGYSKYIGEEIIKKYCKNYTIFRFGNVFGERQKNGLIARLKKIKKTNEEIEMYNNGEGIRDYVYVKDVVRALSNYHSNKEIYNIGTGKAYFTRNIIRNTKVRFKNGKEIKEIKESRLNIDKISGLGWEPTLDPITYLNKKVNQKK